eukprot:8385322-Pyramimonas_sp.AAC.1
MITLMRLLDYDRHERGRHGLGGEHARSVSTKEFIQHWEMLGPGRSCYASSTSSSGMGHGPQGAVAGSHLVIRHREYQLGQAPHSGWSAYSAGPPLGPTGRGGF